MGKLGQLLDQEIKKRGMSHAEFGKLCGGINQQSVSGWVRAEKPVIRVNDDNLKRIAEATGLPFKVLMELRNADLEAAGRKPKGNIPQSARDTVARINGPILSSSGRDLPLRGMAAGGGMERVFFSDISGDTYEWVDRPANLVGIDDAYGVEMREMSMADRYLPNKDVLHVNPRKPVYVDDFVVVHVRDAQSDKTLGFVKQFKGYEGERAVFRQLNPAKTIRFLMKDIEAIHPIVGSSIRG